MNISIWKVVGQKFQSPQLEMSPLCEDYEISRIPQPRLCRHIYAYMHTHIYIYTYIHIYIHIYIYIHTHVYTYIYVYTYTHVYTNIEAILTWTYTYKYRKIWPLKPDPGKLLMHTQTIPWIAVKKFGWVWQCSSISL